MSIYNVLLIFQNEDLSKKDIRRVFDVFDMDEKGKVDLSDIRRVAMELGETLTGLFVSL